MIRAILWAQWRSMRTFSGRSILSAITGIIFYGFWLFAAFGVQLFFSNPENSKYFMLALSAGLTIVTLYWQLAPLITATLGASLDLKKLLVYPIPHQRLFLIEILLRITTCAEMLLLLMGVAVGIVRNPETGGPTAIPRVAITFVLFCASNLLLSAGIRSLIERTMMHKRLKWIGMVFAFGFSILPQYLIHADHGHIERFKGLLTPSVLFPWSAAAHLFLDFNSMHNRAQSLLVLLVFTAVCYAFGRWQFAAGLRFDGQSSTVRVQDPNPTESVFTRALRFPARFFTDPTAAIIEKEMLSLSRMSPFRMTFLTASAFGILLWLPHILSNGDTRRGFMAENILAFASAYAILMLGQVSYFNCFGFDRSAAQAWFALPVSISRTLIAKNIAISFFLLAELCLTALVVFILRVPLSPLKLAESFSVSIVTALYLISIGNIASARFPYFLDPDKVNQGGSGRVTNLLLLPSLPVILSPVGIAYWARSVFESEAIFFALMLLAALLGCILYWIAMESATATLTARSEKILAELSRGEGPVSAT